MTKTILKAALRGSSYLCSVALITVAAPQVALAQDAAPDCVDADSDGACDAVETADSGASIIVTGSRIAKPTLESTVPILSVAGESFIEQGTNNIGDTLNELPQLRSTRQSNNSATGIGIAGLNLLDLRGLGTNRTLVLVNGRRHVAADLTSNASSPDINTLPLDLVERVDIVTGGNSAIYGSDAIAGVVNFVLKRDFDGVQLRGGAGVSMPGGYGGNQFVSAVVGKNFADGRGNITLHGEYSRQDRILASQIPNLRTVEGLNIVDADPGTALNGSDGNPDSQYFTNIRQRNSSRYGLVIISQPNANPACGLGAGTTATNGTAFNCLLAFDAFGNLAPSNETVRFGTGPIGGAANATNLDTSREGDIYSILPRQSRYNANLLAHYEFSEALDAFVEAKFVRVNSFGSGTGYAGISGSFGTGFDQRERIRLDNPYLTTAQRTTIANALLASGCRSSLTQACSTTTSAAGYNGFLDAGQIAAINAGTYRFSLARLNVAGTPRDERFQRDTFRVVAGLRGTFMDDWTYEISGNYGRMEESTVTRGFIDAQRLALSLDAGFNPATNRIQCRSQYDPAAAVAYDRGVFQAGGTSRGNADQLARLAADIAACVPFNPFGDADNKAAQAYFVRPSFNEGWITQKVVSGFVSGDSSEFLNLWGGPVSFALGAEYREEDIYLKQDDFAGTAGNTNNVVLGPSGVFTDPPKFTVKEAFGEIRIPILADRPFFEELTLSGAGRVAKYQGGVGTVWAYNAGVDYAPVRDIRFRANYSRAVRAPFLSETSGALVNNFSPNFQDPCQPSQIGTGTQFRNANCTADLGGLPARNGAYSLKVVSGPNPNLQAENSDSWTFGAVLQPRWIPNLSLTVDYYDITVNGIIASPSAQQIANSCYDQPTLDNVFCRTFSRFRGPGVGPDSEVPGEILSNSLLQSPLNYASRTRRGIDTQLDYRTSLTDDVNLRLFAIWTHNLEINNYENPADPTFTNRILGELGDPEDEFRIDTDLSVGAFTFGHSLRYIGKMTVGAWENYFPLDNRAPQNLDASPIRYYPEVFYHNFRLEWDVNGEEGDGNLGRDLNFYVGVDNAFNKVPPLGASGSGAGGGGGGADRPGSANTTGAIYDVRGRQFYAGVKMKF
ncbi:Colicin I receptor precursor [Tsuneonella dongtanensis]|uniref:Colicin I receptor n=1 Tax=Tsuneonella dongtanensis TaxID=692370 RepID=A0A1B2AGR6_9SPHN|nr:TonB-dependent receptor [Tsuneonella dongtanensis]ANY21330.1 Colicin I receptor precursor [Tsuneonella dongtanensis]